MKFKDRKEAGQKLAEALRKYKNEDAIVYALPRGGVVLGFEVAKELNIPLDLVITRKIGHPFQEEYAICAVAEDGDMLCNEEERLAIDEKWLEKEKKKEQEEAKRRREIYLSNRKSPSAENKTAIIIDDGIATGLTMSLAISEIKHKKPKRIIVAVPVASSDFVKKIKGEVDESVILYIPDIYLGAVGMYYDDFSQVEDGEVIKLLGTFG